MLTVCLRGKRAVGRKSQVVYLLLFVEGEIPKPCQSPSLFSHNHDDEEECVLHNCALLRIPLYVKIVSILPSFTLPSSALYSLPAFMSQDEVEIAC